MSSTNGCPMYNGHKIGEDLTKISPGVSKWPDDAFYLISYDHETDCVCI